jgi:catechol 2,3-dioxygenase-like lactoylglutathione lyase family enzyme
VAEWLRNGLQNRVHQFNSGRGLHQLKYLTRLLSGLARFGAGCHARSPVGSYPARHARRQRERRPEILPHILGIPEAVKPPDLAARGGCWFEAGNLKVHLGVEKNFAPARKAHPAFIVDDLAGLTAALTDAGYAIAHDRPLQGYERIFVDDPFGNRIELMEVKDS